MSHDSPASVPRAAEILWRAAQSGLVGRASSVLFFQNLTHPDCRRTLAEWIISRPETSSGKFTRRFSLLKTIFAKLSKCGPKVAVRRPRKRPSVKDSTAHQFQPPSIRLHDLRFVPPHCYGHLCPLYPCEATGCLARNLSWNPVPRLRRRLPAGSASHDAPCSRRLTCDLVVDW